jgi:Acyl-CoA synthetases (AMP-forming)/AMP-acid ligases II
VLLHPAVAEAAAVSAPHERLGEGVAVFVTIYGDEAPTLANLTELCAEQQLAKQKWPQWLSVVAEMPKTPSGKIQKAALRAQLKEQGVQLS